MAGDIDIPVGFCELLDSRSLFDMRTAVMVHKDHPLSFKDTVTIKELNNEKIFMPAQGSGFHNRLLQLFEYYDIPLPAENAYSLLSRQQMISENLGISFSTIFPDKNYQPNIRYIPLEDPFGPWNVRMWWKKNHRFTKDELLFKEFVESYFK
jgi:DNA-binding transcriptional LysR family regulator